MPARAAGAAGRNIRTRRRAAAALSAALLMATLTTALTGAARQPARLAQPSPARPFRSGRLRSVRALRHHDRDRYRRHRVLRPVPRVHVIASTLPNTGSGREIDAAAHYLVTQNGVAASVFHGHPNVNEVAAAGTSQGATGAVRAVTSDPALIKTVMTFSLPGAAWAAPNPDCPTAADCTAHPDALTRPAFFVSTHGFFDSVIASPATERAYFLSAPVHAALGIIKTRTASRPTTRPSRTPPPTGTPVPSSATPPAGRVPAARQRHRGRRLHRSAPGTAGHPRLARQRGEIAAQNLARTPAATSSGLRSISASP